MYEFLTSIKIFYRNKSFQAFEVSRRKNLVLRCAHLSLLLCRQLPLLLDWPYYVASTWTILLMLLSLQRCFADTCYPDYQYNSTH